MLAQQIINSDFDPVALAGIYQDKVAMALWQRQHSGTFTKTYSGLLMAHWRRYPIFPLNLCVPATLRY